MRTLNDPTALGAEALERRARGETIGFVPTMGFLHAGHVSLFELARPLCDWLVGSIYVNPLQFGPDEDLGRYPRDPEGDAASCASAGVDMLFVPPELYAPDHSTRVVVDHVTRGLCGEARPGHFEGVATVVARLFGLVQPSVAVFGEKDYQQLVVIRRMVRDLAMPIEIVGAPLVRDADGLALSSRNAYLSDTDRTRALSLNRALRAMRDCGKKDVAQVLALGRSILDVDRVDYLSVVDAENLEPKAIVDGSARALVAAWVGGTRLIDNIGWR
ncbi:MAG: pantoate--beta-alanine ligase [Myxococcota bacterium]|nr:pantoate--beta-alanine ligase [Myxococcota bacterium]